MKPVDPVDVEAGGPRNQAAVAVRSDKCNVFEKKSSHFPGNHQRKKQIISPLLLPGEGHHVLVRAGDSRPPHGLIFVGVKKTNITTRSEILRIFSLFFFRETACSSVAFVRD